MNKNIDLTKLLKHCPKGTKFYSRFLGSVEFCKITSDNYIEITDKNGYYIRFEPNGIYQHSEEDAEIDIFPSKDQRDWSKWQRPFVDGDVVMFGDDQFAIFKEYIKHPETDGLIRYYLYYDAKNDDLDTNDGQAYVQRLATEEEKKKLFDVIREKGYRWNTESKTLENWTIQDAKEGDVIFYDDGWTCIFKCIHGIWYSSYCFITSDGEFHTGYEEHAVDSKINGNVHIATKEQRDLLFQTIKEAGYKWNPETKTFEKLIEPKFKVGDIVQSKTDNNDKFTITNIDNNKFYYGCGNGHEFMIPVVKQDNWELVPVEPKFKEGDTIISKNGLQTYKITGVTSEYYSVKVGEHDCVGVLPVKDQDDWILIPNKSITEYKIYYNRYTTDDDNHVGFTTLEAMKEALNSMRETNKVSPTYFNIVCKKETVERLEL